MTVLANQRMHASSRKSTRKLMTNSSAPARSWTCPGVESPSVDAACGSVAAVTGPWVTDSPGSIDERHGRDHRRLDLPDDAGGVLDLLPRHVEVCAGAQHLRPEHADQDAMRPEVSGHLGGRPQRAVDQGPDQVGLDRPRLQREALRAFECLTQ